MKTAEQIKAMLEAGFSDAQIKTFLNVGDEDIESVRNSRQEEESKTEKPETHKLERVGRRGTKIDEGNFSLIRQDFENGMKREEICEKYGIANALYYKIKKSPTFKDFCDLRKVETNKKRRRAKPSFRIGDGEYHTKKREPKYTKEIWNEGKKMHNLGVPYREIAARQGFSVNYVAKVLRLPSYDAVENARKKEQDKRKAEFEKTKAMVKAEAELGMQLEEAILSEQKQEAVEQETIEETLAKHENDSDNRMYIEYCSMADSLARIAEALEKIANKKRGLFRK